jgi:hypothetical protein
MKVDFNKQGTVESVTDDNLPWLYLIRNMEELKAFTGRLYWYDDGITFPCWAFEIEHQCSSDYYLLTKEMLEALLQFGDIHAK